MSFRNFGDFEEVIVCAGGSDEDSKTAQHVWCYSDKKNKWFSLTSIERIYTGCMRGNRTFSKIR
jgi:hypothetical protein